MPSELNILAPPRTGDLEVDAPVTAGRRPHRRGRAIAAFVVAAGLSIALAGQGDATDSAVRRAWRLEAKFQFREAHGVIEQAGDSRPARFARAMTLLNVPPKTQDNIAWAADLLADLAQQPDDIGISAKYFLARIEQAHRYQPNVDRALALYEELIDRHLDHYFGQMALVKWAIVKLYDPRLDQAEREALFDRVEAMGAKLTRDDPRRSFAQVLADAMCRFEQPDARALKHLLVVDELGAMTRTSEADLYVRIGELARLSGQTELARRYYRRMLEQFPRDIRVFMVRQRLAGLDAKPDATARTGADGGDRP